MPRATRIKLTKDMIEAIERHIKRTGKGPYAAFKGQPGIPKGVHARLVSRWLHREAQTVRADFYEFVLDFWEAIPSKKDQYAKITAEVLENLRAHRERTGVSTKMLFKEREDAPEGLDPSRAENLLQGRFKTFPRDHLEYLIWNWEILPDKIPRIQITPDILSQLHSERERTGIAAMALLWGTQDERPEGLNGYLVNSWMEGRTKSARQDHLEYVFAKWRRLPDREK